MVRRLVKSRWDSGGFSFYPQDISTIYFIFRMSFRVFLETSMDKFSLDYAALGGTLSRPKHYRYEDVKHKLVKVAFDVVRFMDSDDIDGLWQVQKTDDGDVIVAMYEQTAGPKESKAGWEACTDKTNSVVNVFYKGASVTAIGLDKIGVPKEDAHIICESLPRKLAADSSFRKNMLDELSEHDRSELLREHPELRE